MRMTIAARLYLGFGLMAALVVASAVVISYEERQAQANYKKLSLETLEAVHLAKAQNALWQLRYGFPQFMVGTVEARQKIVDEEPKWYEQINSALEEYSQLDLSAQDKQSLAALRDTYAKYIEARPRWFELYGSGKIQEAAQWRAATTTPLGAATVKSMADLIELQQAHSVATHEAIAGEANTLHRSVLIFIALSLLVAAAIALGLTRSIVAPLEQLVSITRGVSQGDFTRRIKLKRADELGALAEGFNSMVDDLTLLVGEVQRSGMQVNSTVTEISATAREQQATATEVAATTTEIGATSKEISATSKELVNTMHEVSGVAEQTSGLAGSGQAGLARMEETMRHVAEAAGSINAKLAVLNEKAGNINQVVTTITKVADQTNLLSLNAAIEAEKAGEAGRGFAVVATEIRRLADQTAVATYDIEQMVKEIQSAVSAGVMGMDKFSEEVRSGIREVHHVGEQLSQIIQQVQALAPRFVAVSEGMQAQATGAEQISDALTQLTDASQQTVQSLQQSTEAIGGLDQVASGLRSAVSRFKLTA